MASKNIKGITVEIGGDTTGLDKALSNVNKQANTLSAEMRQVDNALKTLTLIAQNCLLKSKKYSASRLKLLRTSLKSLNLYKTRLMSKSRMAKSAKLHTEAFSVKSLLQKQL